MPKVVCNLFKRPSCLEHSVGKIMTQVMKADIGDLLRFLWCCPLFERTKPMMEPCFAQTGTALRREDIGTPLITTPLLEVGIEGTPRFVHQVNVPNLYSGGSEMEPSTLGSHMRVFYLQMGDVCDATPSPVSQGKHGV